MEIVEQRPDRTEVEDTQASPILAQHPGQDWQDGSLRLPARCWGHHDNVVTPKDNGYDLLLERPQLTPAKTVDDVVLKTGMEEIEGGHEVTSSQFNVINAGCRRGVAFRWGEFRVLDRQFVMLMGVEVGELVDAVQDIGH